MDISFKPAPLRKPQTWTLSGNVLTTPQGKRLDLTEVTDGHFSDLPVKRYWVAEFKLVSAGETVVITCNDTRSGGSRENYFLLIFELLDSLRLHNSTLTLRRGTGRLFNILFACVGIMPLGFGVSFIIRSFIDGAGAFGIGLGIFFMLLGAFVIWSASPW